MKQNNGARIMEIFSDLSFLKEWTFETFLMAHYKSNKKTLDWSPQKEGHCCFTSLASNTCACIHVTQEQYRQTPESFIHRPESAGGTQSEAQECVSLLYAGVKWFPEHKRVQPHPQLLRDGHDNVEVSFHCQIQVRLQIPQRSKWLLAFLPVSEGEGVH